jgi:hypothetical protein
MSLPPVFACVQAFVSVCIPLCRTPIPIVCRARPSDPNDLVAILDITALTPAEKQYVRYQAANFFTKNTNYFNLFFCNNELIFGAKPF